MRLFLLLALPATALAQELPDVDYTIPDVQHVDFGTVDVNASVDRPEAIVITETQRPAFPVFITLRADFRPEMKHSTREL